MKVSRIIPYTILVSKNMQEVNKSINYDNSFALHVFTCLVIETTSMASLDLGGN